MARELESSGFTVGSERYFQALNERYFIRLLMKNRDCVDYKSNLHELVRNIEGVLSEVYKDLREHADYLRFIPESDREGLTKLVFGLYDVGEIVGKRLGLAEACVDLLTLRSYDSRAKSYASERELNNALDMLEGREARELDCDPMELIRNAMERGEASAADGVELRRNFLASISRGQGRDFYTDLWQKRKYTQNIRNFSGRCGKQICSTEYQDYIEQKVFGGDLRSYYVQRGGRRTYASLIQSSFEGIAQTLEADLADGERDNDYILDANADRLNRALDSLESCGVRCYFTKNRVTKLAWFVGGEYEKIRTLQRNLNRLGVRSASGQLEEDGVYGKQTLSAWENFLDKLLHGSIPSLAWIDPYQSGVTGIFPNIIPHAQQGNTFSMIDKSSRSLRIGSDGPRGVTVFRPDVPHTRGAGNYPYNHINTVNPGDFGRLYQPSNQVQAWLLAKTDHMKISEKTYNILKRFDGVAKVVRIAGKILLITGIVLDALELGLAIKKDLNDADQKLGRTTASAVVSIVGTWGGAIAGAKIGAMVGAVAGAAIAPPLAPIGGLAGGLVLGIVGAAAGDAFAEWVIDITFVGE